MQLPIAIPFFGMFEKLCAHQMHIDKTYITDTFQVLLHIATHTLEITFYLLVCTFSVMEMSLLFRAVRVLLLPVTSQIRLESTVQEM